MDLEKLPRNDCRNVTAIKTDALDIGTHVASEVMGLKTVIIYLNHRYSK